MGGVLFLDDEAFCVSGEPTREVVEALANRATQIIPLEFLALAGTIFTLRDKLRGLHRWLQQLLKSLGSNPKGV